MKKVVAIYTGPLVAGILLALLGGMNIANGLTPTAEDFLSVFGIIWSLVLLYNSVQVSYEA